MTALLAFEDVPLVRLHRTTIAGPLPLGGGEGPFRFELGPNQTVAILGDDASGVDTLGGLALGLERPIQGRVLTLGLEPGALGRQELLAFRRKLGYLPAGDGLLQNLTLRDNIRLPLRFGSDFRSRDIEGRINVILAQLRLTRVADLRPAQASDEDRRRAALGRALAFDPELVILEQPFDGMTDRVAAELLEAARGGETAQGSRRAVLITGQALPALLRSRVDRTYRLHHGRLDAS
jgi:ABC-type multidrug transport system ATPase subunit